MSPIAIGTWDHMQEIRTSPFYKMEVWDAAGPGSIQFDNSTESRTEPLGYMIENSIMLSAFHKRLQSLSSVELFCPSSIDSIQFPKEGNDEWVKVSLKDGRKLEARLVVIRRKILS